MLRASCTFPLQWDMPRILSWTACATYLRQAVTSYVPLAHVWLTYLDTYFSWHVLLVGCVMLCTLAHVLLTYLDTYFSCHTQAGCVIIRTLARVWLTYLDTYFSCHVLLAGCGMLRTLVHAWFTYLSTYF